MRTIAPHRRTADLEELEAELYLEIPELSSAVAIPVLQRAAIQFCEKSQYWQEDLGPVRVAAPTPVCEVFTSGALNLVDVRAVALIDGEDRHAFEASASPIGSTYRYWQISPTEIEVGPHEALKGKDLSVIASVKPAYGDEFELSELVLREYRDTLLHGAKAALFRMPRKEWTDIGLSRDHQILFERGCIEALAHQAQGFSRVSRGAASKPRPMW